MYMYINVQIPQAWPVLYEEVPHNIGGPGFIALHPLYICLLPPMK